MILTCPSCSTRYRIKDGSIGPSGRSVKCAKCGHEWVEMPEGAAAPAPQAEAPPPPPPAEEPAPPPPPAAEPAATEPEAPAPEPEAPEEPAPAAADAEEAPAEAEPEPEPEPAPRARPRPAPAARAAAEAERRGVGAAAWIALLLVVGGLGAAGYFYRTQIVEIWPPAAKLYQTLGSLVDKPQLGLEIRNVESAREIQGGQVVLLIAGEVVNNSGENKPIPNLRVALGDENKIELYHWTVAATESELPPGGSTRFQSRLPNPPDNARKLVVTFLLDEVQ